MRIFSVDTKVKVAVVTPGVSYKMEIEDNKQRAHDGAIYHGYRYKLINDFKDFNYEVINLI
jgi:hypothetical protein